ncbi:MAG: hypothetical protein JWR83_2825 [Aeromicrobium sp.]|nr:hypothetical protein [Aeromicrobium sp.]
MIGLMNALETDYLVPSPAFIFATLLVVGVLVIWPLIEALRSRHYIWALAIVLSSPIGGILWLAIGRRHR